MRITLTIPTVQAPQLASNVLGAAGLIGLVIAIGALAGNWWWSLLAGSLVAIGLAWVANTHAQAEAEPDGDAETKPRPRNAASRSA